MRPQRERRRDFRMRFMGLLTGGQSGQLMNSGVLSGGRQNPPAKRFARYPCRPDSISGHHLRKVVVLEALRNVQREYLVVDAGEVEALRQHPRPEFVGRVHHGQDSHEFLVGMFRVEGGEAFKDGEHLLNAVFPQMRFDLDHHGAVEVAVD